MSARPAVGRRKGCFELLCLLLLACRPASGGPVETLVLISLDTLRADRIGAYGYSRPTTPHLDAFADDALLFEHAIAQSNWTAPSHRSLMRGRQVQAADSGPTLAETLHAAGFRTVGLTGGGFVAAELGFGVGFDEYLELDGGLAEAAPLVRDRLEGRNPGDRLFLFIHTYDIHSPYDPPAQWRDRFGRPYDGPIRPETTNRVIRRVLGLEESTDLGSAQAPLEEADIERLSDLYDAGVAYTDHWLGTILRDLESLTEPEKTVVVVLSDHGEELWDHGSLGHGATLYQEILEVPLILRAPSISPRRIHSTVRLLDVVPTLLELAAVEAPPGLEGKSLLSLAAEGSAHRVAVSEGNGWWSCIAYPGKRIEGPGGPRFFDLARDPKERRALDAAEAPRRSQPLEAGCPTRGPHSLDAGPESPAALSPVQLERLRSLGYLGR